MSPSAPTILVVHGALGAAAQMIPVAEALGALGAVRLVELPGHGNTPLGDQPFAVETFAAAVRTEAAETRPFVFGYSMGGYAALVAEWMWPGAFAGILAVGTKFAWNPEESAREANRLVPDKIREKAAPFATALESRHRGAGGWELLLERSAALFRAIGDESPLTPSVLSSIAPPTTIAVGDADRTVSVPEAVATAMLVQQGKHVVLPGVAHPIETVPAAALVPLMADLMARAGG